MKYAKLKEDWTVILELVRQHKERMAALLVAKKASKLFSKQCVRRCIFQEIMLLVLVYYVQSLLLIASAVNCCKLILYSLLFYEDQEMGRPGYSLWFMLQLWIGAVV